MLLRNGYDLKNGLDGEIMDGGIDNSCNGGPNNTGYTAIKCGIITNVP